MARYTVELTVEVEMEIDPEVVAVALTPEWQAELYRMNGEADVLEMLAWNCVLNDRALSSLDGWADREDSAFELVNWEITNTEVIDAAEASS